MDAINGLMRLNGPEKVNRSTPNGQDISRSLPVDKRNTRDLAIGKASFEYKEGPDGKKYVVHGEVNIDSSPVSGDTEATIEKAIKIQRAALAPSNPSAKDLQAAAQARIMESKAHRKLAREKQFENDNNLVPGLKAYQTTRDLQEHLYKILELFA